MKTRQSNVVFSTFLSNKKMFTRAFLIAGLGFLAVCLVGYITSLYIYDALLAGDLLSVSNTLTTAMVLILASSILNIFWAFRVHKASRVFIFFAFTLFIAGQGAGFGILFASYNLQDLMSIFGSAGLIFLFMAVAGYRAKDLSPMIPFLIAGAIGLMVMGLLSMVFVLSGVYSDSFMILWTVLSGVLIMAYTAFDVWRLKVLSNQASRYSDSEMVFRFTAFMGFRLLSDLVSLVWIIARLYSRFSR